MGGSKKAPAAPPPPAFQGGMVYDGNRLVSQTAKEGDNVITRYFNTPQEQQTKDYSAKRINELLPTLNSTSPEVMQQAQQLGNAYRDEQLQQFNQQYDPALRGLTESIANRFGTLKASPFLDEFTRMEQTIKQPALASINRDATMQQQGFEDRAQGKKYQELEALGFQLNDNQRNFLAGLQTPQSLSSTGNAFAQQDWANLINKQQMDWQNRDKRTGLRKLFDNYTIAGQVMRAFPKQ